MIQNQIEKLKPLTLPVPLEQFKPTTIHMQLKPPTPLTPSASLQQLTQVTQLTNKQLYNLCRACGNNIRKFLKKFASYLPEVEKRRLYKHYGCHTLYEFAAKLAGMNKDTVDDILNVHQKLTDKPILQQLISKQGWSKVKVVATIATPETEKFWAEKLQIMSKETLKTFVKELRKESHEVLANGQGGLFEHMTQVLSKGQNGIFESATEVSTNAEFSIPFEHATKGQIPWPEPSKQMDKSQKSAAGNERPSTYQLSTLLGGHHPVQKSSTFSIRLDDKTETKLRIFKQKLEKKTREPQDWNQTIKELLGIASEHEVCGKQQRKKQKNALTIEQIQAALPHEDKRYIPASVQHYLEQKYQGKCAFTKCNTPSEIFHHTRRFALKSNHNPDYIVPLCKTHEQLAHHGLIADEDLPPKNWKIRLNPDKNSPKYQIDQKVQKFRFPGRN